jgi:glutathione synthase
MRVAFVADPLESLDAGIDTTVGLMHAVQDAGHEVWATQADQLEIADGRPRAYARPIQLAATAPAGGHRWWVPLPWFDSGPTEAVWLDGCDAVFMRTEPPVDESYVNATWVLDLIDPDRTALINHPRGLRSCSEHLLPLRFPHLAPATVVTSRIHTIRAFVADFGTCVIKPVDGFAGRGVLRLGPDDPNLASLLEIATCSERRAVVVQRYLSEVRDGNKRIFVLDEEPIGAVYRFPRDDDFRIGNPTAPAPLTSWDRHICAGLAPMLARHGLRMAGLDVIGQHLIEVNITSPGALRKADALLGTDWCAEHVSRFLTRTPNQTRRSA